MMYLNRSGSFFEPERFDLSKVEVWSLTTNPNFSALLYTVVMLRVGAGLITLGVRHKAIIVKPVPT
ncbi:hypothetical protein [Coleofasciculus sp. G2-EDA-02]|uniref:hypothetical protein n=1 Tax=Coleofasciculus sp. G2-EDA-02 TaxID=3069529 RepID=UPI0032FA595F